MSAEKILEAITVTSELTGTVMSETAKAVMTEDLLAYPLPAVMHALTRCRKELTGRLSLAAVLERLQCCDGRPGAEEAWGMIAAGLADERVSVVWSEEMALASAAASPLIQIGDKVGARMAFRETYERVMAEARESGLAPKWTLSAGTDRAGRESAIKTAVQAGRLPAAHAIALLPSESTEVRHELLTGHALSIEDKRRAAVALGKIQGLLAAKISQGEPA